MPIPSCIKTWTEHNQDKTGDDPVFPSYERSKMTKMFKKAADELGIKGAVQYSLRHTKATNLAQRGVGFEKLQRWMGHKKASTTMRYIRTNVDDLEDLL